jgi:methionyl-tRNA synthetase
MQAFTPFYSPFTVGLLSIFVPIILVVVLWTVTLKGFALWYAARAGQKWWFIALLVVNTIGILEIIYLIWFRPKSPAQTKEVESAPAHTSSPAQ